jgi:hypothetical protein
MTWKDKLEIGLKDDAPFRRDNLPDFQKTDGGATSMPGDPTRSPEEPGARQDAAAPPRTAARPKPATRRTRTGARAPAANRAARKR